MSQIQKECGSVQKCTYWVAANIWLESAKCMKDTGVWLALEDSSGASGGSGTIIPFENGSLADDCGHAFLLGWISKILDRELGLVDVARLNAYINLIGLVGIACYFLATRNYFIFAAILAATNPVFFRKVGFNPHIAHIGATSLTFLLPLGLLAYHYRWLGKRGSYFFITVGVISLALTCLIRGVLGHMGLFVSFGTLCFVAWHHRKSCAQLAFLSLLGVTMLVAWQSPSWLIHVRNSTLNLQTNQKYKKSIFEGSHGISHSLFIGLGSVENAFGLEWKDMCGQEKVKQVSLDIPYCSKEYFDTLNRLYFEYLRKNPLEVARIYLAKLVLLLKFIPLTASLLTGLLFAVGYFFRIEADWKKMAPLLILSMAWIFLFIVQGVLAHPSGKYAAPIATFACVYLGLALEYAFRVVYGLCTRQKTSRF
ncbi:MAG: hypothetical protein AAF443_05720 [Chlamydiota bacterium]